MANIMNIRLDRPLTSYAAIRGLVTAMVRNSRWQLRAQRVRELHYLDVGCGTNIHDNFINLDWAWHPRIDLCWDIRRGIPLPSHSLFGIFSEHALEHLMPTDAERFIGECRRTLRPDGRLRIVVPDAELWLTRYADRVRGLTNLLFPYEQEPVGEPMASINGVFYIGRAVTAGHCCMYDFGLLRALLVRCGFTRISRAEFRSGADATLLIDSEMRKVESLYVEAS